MSTEANCLLSSSCLSRHSEQGSTFPSYSKATAKSPLQHVRKHMTKHGVSVVVQAQAGVLHVEGLLLEGVDESVDKKVDEDDVRQDQEAAQGVVAQKPHRRGRRRVQKSAHVSFFRAVFEGFMFPVSHPPFVKSWILLCSGVNPLFQGEGWASCRSLLAEWCGTL